MYKIETKAAPDTDASDEEIEFSYQDLVNAIDLNLPEGSTVWRDKNLLLIETNLDEKEIKDLMQPAFSYHFESIRFLSIKKAS